MTVVRKCRGVSLFILSAIAALTLEACGGSATSGAGGSPDGGASAASPPDAFVEATMGPGAGPGGSCALTSPQSVLSIGSTGAGRPMTVADGQSQNGHTAQVSCSVAAAGSGFDVKLHAAIDGGGGFDVSSPAGAGAVTETGGQGISVTWQDPVLGTAREDDCSLAFTYAGDAVPASPAVAPGRIWAHVSCPNAAVSPSSGTMAGTCDGEADFLFENCTQ